MACAERVPSNEMCANASLAGAGPMHSRAALFACNFLCAIFAIFLGSLCQNDLKNVDMERFYHGLCSPR
jgi:hypothetical protein